jgi:uncharacterized protein (DUF1501 family)
MQRRQFLKSTLASGMGSLFSGISDWSLAAELSNANKSNAGPLIVVFLRGGADGLAILSPLEDPHFLAARPPEIRFEIEKAANTVNLNLNGTRFYWHPAAKALNQLYANQRLIAWPAVGILDETRSHFEAQEIIERGAKSLQGMPDSLGWMARQLKAKQAKQSHSAESLSTLPLFAGSNTMPRAMQGAEPALAARDLQGGVWFPGGPAGLKAIQALSQADRQHLAAPMIASTFNTFEQVSLALPRIDNKVLPYETAGSTPYPNYDPAVGLRSIARIIQAKMGLQYAWVDHGGWDTHEGQGWRINYLIEQLGNSLLAFDQDMQARNEPYQLVVLTEFGRRLVSNKSGGTDHGHGSLALVLGNPIAGGKMQGRWPGLDTASLDRGVDLAVTTDYLELLKQRG